MSTELTEPWRSFLADVDARLTHDVELHCCGGFVVTTLYGFQRTTADPTAVPLDVAVLRQRYDIEMRSYVPHTDREGLTLELWSEIIQEAQARSQS